MATEQIRGEEPVKNSIHNLVQTLSVKLDSAARYGLYHSTSASPGRESEGDLTPPRPQPEISDPGPGPSPSQSHRDSRSIRRPRLGPFNTPDLLVASAGYWVGDVAGERGGRDAVVRALRPGRT